jgi:NADPH-dependent 2,4-dienoyl-CoA reductase/sulfur reductase-like enzyme
MSRRPLVIVGAGPAGLAAAIAAAAAGVRPLVLDENPQVGGQIYRQPPSGTPPAPTHRQTPAARRGAELLSRFHAFHDFIEVQTETDVWGLFPPRQVAIARQGASDVIEADQLILAPGAYEYVVPFPGWTLPGVMTPGAAQLMVKTMHVLPGRRALVAGTGPFLLVVAEQLARAGMEVVGVIEATTASESLRAVPRLLAHFGLLREGLGYIYRLRRLGVPVERGRLVVEACGDTEVRAARIAPCDHAWHPDGARARTVDVDTLCVAYGFVPRTQLAQLAGCRLRFDEDRGGWVPEVDEDLQTTVPGVGVAGDGGGVGGAVVAQEEGTLAGLAAAHRLGALDAAAWSRARGPILHRLGRLRRFRTALDRLSRLRAGLDLLATPGTVVCRCEERTREEIDRGVAFGATDLRTLKVMTRLGMGPCQGRMCWPATARRVAAMTGRSVEEVGPLSVRPPLRPLDLSALAGEQV